MSRTQAPIWNQLVQLTFKSQISLQAQIRETAPYCRALTESVR